MVLLGSLIKQKSQDLPFYIKPLPTLAGSGLISSITFNIQTMLRIKQAKGKLPEIPPVCKLLQRFIET